MDAEDLYDFEWSYFRIIAIPILDASQLHWYMSKYRINF
jgi:hypothetical protein